MKPLRILITVSLFLLSSCSLQKRCALLYPPVRDTVTSFRDSVSIIDKVNEVNVPVYLPKDSIVFRDSLRCATLQYSKEVSTKNLHASVVIKDGVLDVQFRTDSLSKVILKLRDTLRTVKTFSLQQTKIQETRAIPVEKDVPYIPKFFWYVLGYLVIRTIFDIKSIWPNVASITASVISKIKG